MSEPLPILASGRDGDIFEFAPGLVLRKTRDGRSIAHEARIMRYVAEQGFPVPRIEEVRADGTEIVMERIDGPIMMDAMVRPPSKLGDHLRLLADLHDQLHRDRRARLAAGYARRGDQLLHLDLHPLNVIMSPNGPVVIDWPNARRGDPMADVALDVRAHLVRTHPAAAPARRWQSARCARRCSVARSPSATSDPRSTRRVAEMAELKCFDTEHGARRGASVAEAGRASPALQRRLRDDGSPRPRHPSASASEPAPDGEHQIAGRRGVSPSAR